MTRLVRHYKASYKVNVIMTDASLVDSVAQKRVERRDSEIRLGINWLKLKTSVMIVDKMLTESMKCNLCV